MRHSVALAVALASATSAAQTPVREVIYSNLDSARPMLFDRGYLLQPAPNLTVYGPDGHLLFDVPVRARDGSDAQVKGAAVDGAGRIAAVIWHAYAPQPTKGALVLLDRSGRTTAWVDLSGFFPDSVCFAPDGSIWVLGAEARKGNEAADYSMVRKFAPDGKPAGAFLPRSLFPGLAIPGYSGFHAIRAAADRIGIVLYANSVGRQSEWFELDFSGKLLGHWQLGSDPFVDLAFTRTATLYSTAPPAPGKTPRLQRWDRRSNSWAPIPGTEGLGNLMGSDGDLLVFLPGGNPRNRLVWIAIR